MSETKTPWSQSPWERIGEPDNIHIVQAGNPDMRICFLTSNGPTEANAGLIAAAPDMAEALEAAFLAMEWSSQNPHYQPGGRAHQGFVAFYEPAIAKVKAALAKAKGESK
jgi:hypothetical protein